MLRPLIPGRSDCLLGRLSSAAGGGAPGTATTIAELRFNLAQVVLRRPQSRFRLPFDRTDSAGQAWELTRQSTFWTLTSESCTAFEMRVIPSVAAGIGWAEVLAAGTTSGMEVTVGGRRVLRRIDPTDSRR